MGYYMGDYYRGDPGIGSFFGGLVKKAVGFIPGVGPALSAIIPGGSRATVARLPAAAGAVTGAVKTVMGKGVATIVKHPVLSAAGAAGALGVLGTAGVEHMMGGGGTGRHRRRPLKHCGVPLKSGKVGKCYRSMNVCNPHALRRAIRRTRGFAKLAMRSIHIIHPKKKGRFGGFKTRRK